MDLNQKLKMSYYKTIAILNEPHNIYLVQHQETRKIYVKKILDVYNISVYQLLKNQSIPGIPKIIDFCEDNNQLIIIEEYISGCSLLEKIQNKELSLNDITAYIVDLCNTLERLHALNPAVIHRDIKPSNIIITNYNKAVLLDFNAAKHFSSTESEDTVLLGTQGYAAPEQYGFGSSSPQTDIYSLGILLKEMLASINLSSEHFNNIINKCTMMNPSERFKDVVELKLAISAPTLSDYKKAKSSSNSSRMLPPGFRTITPWKMLVASPVYFFVTWLCFSIKIENTFGLLLWIEKISLYLTLLSIIFVSFNYMNVHSYLPLCNHKNWFIRIIGIAIWDIAMFFALLMILSLIVLIFFP